MPDSLDQPIGSCFESQVELYPGRLAVKADDAQFTYAELNRHANRIARAILDSTGPGEPVAILFDPGAWMAAAILGAVKAGRPYVPLDPAQPAERLQATLHDCGAGLTLSESSIGGLNGEAGDENPRVSVSADDTLVILYTSGSTGKPKGVAHSHRNILFDTRRQSRDLALTPDDGLVLFFSPVFSASLSPLYGALLNGAALYPFRLKQRGLAEAAAMLQREPVTICDMTVSMFRHFCAGLPPGARFANLRLVSVGGEPVWSADIRTFREHFPADCRLQVTLASTECRVIAQYFIDSHTAIAEGQVPVGYPVDGKRLLMLDSGEIAIRSRYIATGYWNQPEATAAAFVREEDGERTFRTGDLGRQDADGLVRHLGRRDDQVKVRGYRITTGEVEAALMQLDEVREAAVVAWDADAGDSTLAAYVVAVPGTSPSPGFLRDALAAKLPGYMVPAAFVSVPQLPLTATGKVDRRALPPVQASSRQEPPQPPRDELEAQVCRIWEEMLGTSPIGIADDFFALGGHSLLAIRMLDRVANECGRRVPVERLFRDATVGGICGADDKTPPMLAFSTAGRKLPFFYVHGDPGLGGLYTRYLPAYLGADQPLYLIPTRMMDESGVLPSIEEIAADNLAMVREAQPHGPYLLGGFCNGGLIAYEMARQLSEADEAVDLTLVIHIRAISKQLRSAAKRYPEKFDGRARLDPAYPLPDTPRSRGMDPQRQRRIMATMTSYMKAIADYTPGPYAGCVTLLWPDEEPKILNDPLAGWAEVAAAVDVRQIRGNHVSCATEHIGSLGSTFKDCLDAAQSSGRNAAAAANRHGCHPDSHGRGE